MKYQGQLCSFNHTHQVMIEISLLQLSMLIRKTHKKDMANEEFVLFEQHKEQFMFCSIIIMAYSLLLSLCIHIHIVCMTSPNSLSPTFLQIKA
jgi:hypothetical protein